MTNSVAYTITVLVIIVKRFIVKANGQIFFIWNNFLSIKMVFFVENFFHLFFIHFCWKKSLKNLLDQIFIDVFEKENQKASDSSNFDQSVNICVGILEISYDKLMANLWRNNDNFMTKLMYDNIIVIFMTILL